MNGNAAGPEDGGKLELHDVLVIETNDAQQLEFEVVGLMEDDEGHAYAVCYGEKVDEFVITDERGRLLEDDALAQEILDEFLEEEESVAEDGSHREEP